jgi:hypothetical protein
MPVAGHARGFVGAKYRSGRDFSGGNCVSERRAQLSNSSAFMTGDVLQTRENGAANINGAGSSAVVDSNSIVRFQPDGFSLDRGSISVATGKGMSVNARDYKITPASGEWIQFYVTRSSETIGIIARKGAITVTCGANSSTVKVTKSRAKTPPVVA